VSGAKEAVAENRMGVGEIAEEMEILGGQEAAAWTGRRWKERGVRGGVELFPLLSLLPLPLFSLLN
jgi:hypothetical protein